MTDSPFTPWIVCPATLLRCPHPDRCRIELCRDTAAVSTAAAGRSLRPLGLHTLSLDELRHFRLVEQRMAQAEASRTQPQTQSVSARLP